jgi:hypothetical protein
MSITKGFRIYYNKITGNIAFIPAIIAIGFLLLSWGMLEIDFSSLGKQMKSGLSWLRKIMCSLLFAGNQVPGNFFSKGFSGVFIPLILFFFNGSSSVLSFKNIFLA